MDPDDLVEALAARSSPAQQQSNGPNYDGRVAVNPQTGQRLVYRISQGGRGRFVALNSETADAQSRERVEAIQGRADIGSRTLNQARSFVRRNFETRTGGLQNTLDGPLRSLAASVRPNMFSDADELQALSNQMIGSNWQPGTSTMMNTATEQEMIRRRYPSPTAQGPANMTTYLNMAEEVAVQRAAVEAMRNWLTQRPNLDGFDADFARREAEIRRSARNAAIEEMRQYQSRDGRPAAGASDIRIDAAGNVLR